MAWADVTAQSAIVQHCVALFMSSQLILCLNAGGDFMRPCSEAVRCDLMGSAQTPGIRWSGQVMLSLVAICQHEVTKANI